MSDNTIYAGRINGNPLCGLNERICVEVKVITDGCKTVYNNEPTQVVLTSFSSPYVEPLTFNNLRGNGAVSISNLTITPVDMQKSRVSYTGLLPVTVYLTDANGNNLTATGEITFYKDVVLSLPQDDTAYSIECACRARSSVGRFVASNELTVSLCAVLVTRVAQKRTVLLPTYGDCVYPECGEFAQICGGENNLPNF